MKNFMNKLFLKQTTIAAYIRYLLLAISVLGLLGVVASSQATTGQSGVASAATGAICQVFTTIRNIIFILGLTLMILGGALYAGANIMPAQSKGGFQGYGMSMIIGGVIGVAIAVAAPFILNLIITAGGASSSGYITYGGSGSGASGAVAVCG